ncbi:hypothetical protein [Rickettsia bellii]|uniref:Uncharacterized protein n=1 Tax=Rickettsia bellii str. RML Mogi TaxID=1359194 RepID=A0A0F3QGY0_RICBE|nr:hypothetical protein [Rickettsia bellii]KJV91798.1 hypothetical protein RBEMOGI_0410 [Rickettsia bellii str. RML Mogi]
MNQLITFLEEKGFIDEATSLRNGATEFKLSYIWDESVIEIAKILRTDNTLTHFELEESLVEHTGVEAIIWALQMNYTITNCTIFLADNYVEIVGGEYAYEKRMYEDVDQIEPLIKRNKEYVKKLSLFINSLFSNDNIPFSIKNFMVLNFYSIADKQLLKKYLIEQQVNDIELKPYAPIISSGFPSPLFKSAMLLIALESSKLFSPNNLKIPFPVVFQPVREILPPTAKFTAFPDTI